MPPTEDFKRAKEGDEGLNTGGMGAVAPARLLLSHPSLLSTVEEKIVGPTVKGLNQEGRGFVGVLYVGVMVTEAGDPYVLEYNCRFGDPETQVSIYLLVHIASNYSGNSSPSYSPFLFSPGYSPSS